MKKLLKPFALFLVALTIVSGAGYWWFSQSPLSSEFIGIIPDQAYIDWENIQLPEVDTNHDRIADALMVKAANAAGATMPVLVSLSYDQPAEPVVKQAERVLSNQSYKFYSAANIISTFANLDQLKSLALVDGVVMVEEDVTIAGLSRTQTALAASATSPIQTAAVAVIDGGTTYDTVYRKDLVESAGAGLAHGNVVAENLLKVNPSTKIVDVAVLDAKAQAPVSRLIEGVDWAIQSKDKFDISSINVSAGYIGQTNFAFNRALSSAAASGLAVVVPVANAHNAGEVAARVPGLVRVGYYTADQPASSLYTKEQVDMLAPTATSADGASAAAAEISGVVSRLISQTGDNNANWWEALSTTVSSVNDVITITEGQLSDISKGDEASMLQFMQSLSGSLQEAIKQLEAGLGDGQDDQLLKQLLDTTSQILKQFPYSTDMTNLDSGSLSNTDLENLLGNLLGNFSTQ